MVLGEPQFSCQVSREIEQVVGLASSEQMLQGIREQGKLQPLVPGELVHLVLVHTVVTEKMKGLSKQ